MINRALLFVATITNTSVEIRHTKLNNVDASNKKYP